MATGGLTLLRKNDAYIGWAKQAAWGTDAAPTQFWRWGAGTGHKPTVKWQQEREGDTQIYVSLIYRASQYHVIKVVEYGRPVTLGCALQALLGTGSDTLTAASASTTVGTGGGVAGGTTLPFTADQGNTGSKSFHVDPGTPGNYTTDYEVITIDCTTRSGTGPYVYTLLGGGTLKFAHAAGQILRTTSSHALAAVRTIFDPYAIEVGLGPSGNSPQQAFRYRDAVCTDLKLSSGPGSTPLKLEHTWYACGVKQLTALTANPSSVYEGTNVPGAAGGPLLHSMAGSSWSLDGAGNVGNAAAVKQAALTLKRALTPDQFVTETTTPNYFLLGNLDISLALTGLFQSYTQYREAYLNGSSANLATDAYQPVFGTAAWTYTNDACNSLAISLANAAYIMADLPQLAVTSDPMDVQIQMTGALSPSVATPLLFTLTNSQNTPY